MTQGAALEAGIVDHLWFAADPQPAISALASYQNDDGGFGKGLELDIESPASNPFATWMGLIYLRSLPATVTEHIRMKAAAWLSENQAADGDWHLSEETRSRGLAPWLTTWTFPSLMPSCCLAGQAAALGIASPRMLDRVDALFREQASLDQVRDGEFYELTPYADYSLTGRLPEVYLAELVSTIVRWAREDRFADSEAFFNFALRGSAELAARIPDAIAHQYVQRALGEQQDDGGWPAEDSRWRHAKTAGVLAGLHRAVV